MCRVDCLSEALTGWSPCPTWWLQARLGHRRPNSAVPELLPFAETFTSHRSLVKWYLVRRLHVPGMLSPKLSSSAALSHPIGGSMP